MARTRVDSGRVALCAMTLVPSLFAAADGDRVTVVPRPSRLELKPGAFALNANARISPAPGAEGPASLLAEWLASDTGVRVPVSASVPAAEHAIELRLIRADAPGHPGGYALTISSARVEIESTSTGGLVYGCQTLRQLLRGHGQIWSLPALEIADSPRLRWRGLMLDCSRTFISLDYLRRAVDLMSYYKLNVLHLHLTDDQGWRVEIRRYPKLTTVGSRFSARFPNERNGYYSQQELRGLVHYAADRGVTIVPEIEMPGHATAALASYPELSCTGGPFEIFPFFSGPNITEDVFCPGNNRTFDFLQGVLEEVADVFPGRFLHIGGDECPTARWKSCSKCQARIRAEHLADESALQGYLVRRVAAVLAARHKSLIGWDEIAETGVPADTAVMFWRSLDGVSALTRAGHDVVLSPTSYCYFDYRQSELPQEEGEGGSPISLDKVYSFDPVPSSLDTASAAHILGVQANLWTHYARTEDAMDRQLFPRLLALAEMAWTPQALRQWPDFNARLEAQCRRLAGSGVKLGLNFRPDAGVWAQPATSKR